MKRIKIRSNFLSRLPKKAVFALIAVAALAGLTAVAVAGFGPDRPTKVYNGPGTPGFDYVTFNSFTNVPKFGDERQFFNGQYADQNQTYYPTLTQLRQGDEITMHVYIHNGADPSLNASGQGIAKNTNVKVELPQGSIKSGQAKATINADNAQPKSVWSTVDLKADNGGFFQFDFVPGSAKLVGNGINQPVSDELVGKGVSIGDVKGCFEFAVAVTFKVKVNMPHYKINKLVRFDGQTSKDWKNEVTAKPGDTVEWGIEFDNIGKTELKSVKIVDEVPANMTPVPGSVKLYNGNYPSGYTYPDSAIQANGKQINVDIGNYDPDINAWVIFKAKVNDVAELQCGQHELWNNAFATPDGYGAVNDTALVKIDQPPCEKPVYSCDALSAVAISKDTYKLTAKATAQGGAKIVGYKFDFGDKTDNFETDKNEVEHKYSKPGEYTATVWAMVDVDGKVKEVTSDNCKTKVKVDDKPVTPIFECTALSVEQLARDKFKFTVTYTTEGKVTLSKIVYNFGDGTEPFHTDKTVVEHTYAAPGNYDVTAKLLFNVDGQTKEDICTAKVQVQPLEQPPVTPPAKELPNTGIGSVLAGFFSTSALGMGIRSWLVSRRALRSSLLGK